ncbi:hypothetical protein FACS189447_03390 [Spirochaetia bacterium]|nr:hypothetical protein FACS189447_03390 [Spirochaetia bacterium]
MTQVGIKIALDTNEAKSAANNLTDAFKSMSEAIKDAEAAGDWKTVSDLAAGMKDIRSVSGGIENGGANDIRTMTANASGIVNTVNQAPGMVNTLGRGDYASAAINGVRGASGGLRDAGKSAAAGGLGTLGKVLGGLGIAGLVGGGILAGGNALSEQWEKVMNPAMNTNAMLNGTGRRENESEAEATIRHTRELREAFGRAARAANQFGYSAEEGMEVIQEMARHGLGGMSYQSAADVLHYERSTNASRGVLMEAEGRFSRFGAGNALGMGYAGTMASGMEKGQYEEFLRSMQGIFEDGIEKGFVKGAHEIAGDMSFISKLSGGNELWKGEQGAKKISQIGNAMSNATNLSGVTDILSFRAADNFVNGLSRSDMADFISGAGLKHRENSYIDSMIMMEKGFNPGLMKDQMGMIEGAEGAGNRTGAIERIRQMYGFNYTSATQLYQMWDENKGNWDQFSRGTGKAQLEKLQMDPGSYESSEMKLLKATEGLSTTMAQMGQRFTDIKIAGLEGIEGWVKGIYGFLFKKSDIKNDYAGLFSYTPTGVGSSRAGRAYRNEENLGQIITGNMIERAYKGEWDSREYQDYERYQSLYRGLSQADKEFLNTENIPNQVIASMFPDGKMPIGAPGLNPNEKYGAADLGTFVDGLTRALEEHRRAIEANTEELSGGMEVVAP